MSEPLAALRELARRTHAQGSAAQQRVALMCDLFDKQVEAIRNPKKLKTIRTGRRGGKTKTLGTYLFDVALSRPGALCLFIALTRPSAKRLIWQELKNLNKRHGLGAQFNNTSLEVTLPNGAQIWLAGASSAAEREKLRGHAFDVVCCDESGSFGEEFEYLLTEILDAALEDYAGTLVLVGTPNAAAAGAFFDRDTSDREDWAHFHWSVLDNPKFPRWAGKKNWRREAKKWWADKCKREGWQEDDPVKHREWLAEWVRDANRLVYRVTDDLLVPALPAGDYTYLLGADLGWNDQKTIVVLACSEVSKQLYVVDYFAESQLLIDDYAEVLKQYIKTYHSVANVCDAGALGKDIVEQLRQRHAIPIEAATKQHKPANISFLNSALKQRRLHFLPGAKAVFQQMKLLQWKDKLQLKTDQAFREDLCDALLYVFRYATNVYKPDFAAEPLDAGKAEEKRMKEAALRRAALQRNGNDTADQEFRALLR